MKERLVFVSVVASRICCFVAAVVGQALSNLGRSSHLHVCMKLHHLRTGNPELCVSQYLVK